MFQEVDLEIKRRKQAEIWKQQEEANAEAKKQQQLQAQRKKQEEANFKARRIAKSQNLEKQQEEASQI